MPALTARESSRYGARLFGYLLVTVLLSGIVAGGGLGAAYTLDADLLPGGAAPGTTAAVVAGAGLVLGGLFLVTGLLTILFTLVADAVHAGMRGPAPQASEQAESDADAETHSDGDDQTSDEESTDGDDGDALAPSTADDDADALTPADDSNPFGEPSETNDPVAASDTGDETYDPTEPIDDPHEAQTDPFGTERDEAGPGEDEAWRKEIEAKLDEQDQRDAEEPQR